MSRIFRPTPASRFPAVTAQGQEAGVRVRLVAVMEDERPPEGPQWDRKEQLFPVGGHGVSSSPPFSEGDVQRQK